MIQLAKRTSLEIVVLFKLKYGLTSTSLVTLTTAIYLANSTVHLHFQNKNVLRLEQIARCNNKMYVCVCAAQKKTCIRKQDMKWGLILKYSQPRRLPWNFQCWAWILREESEKKTTTTKIRPSQPNMCCV